MAVLVVLLLTLCVGALVFSQVGIAAMRRLVGRGVDDAHNDVSAALFGVGGTIYAVFLAFIVIAVWEAHDSAKDNLAEEASLLATLYRGTVAMEPESGGQLRAAIRAYTHAVVEDEWPVQAQAGGAATSARNAALDFYRVFAVMPDSARQHDAIIARTQLDLISTIQADRNKRTLAAQESVSPVIWVVAVANGLMVLVMSFFLYPGRDWPHVAMSTILAAMISTLLYVIFIFDRPYGGLLPLKPDAFRHSLEVYDSVDQAARSWTAERPR